MFYHFVLHCTFKSEASLARAAAIHHQHSVAQRRQRAQPQVLHPFVGVVHQLNLRGSKRFSGLMHFNHGQQIIFNDGYSKSCNFWFLLLNENLWNKPAGRRRRRPRWDASCPGPGGEVCTTSRRAWSPTSLWSSRSRGEWSSEANLRGGNIEQRSWCRC